VLIRLIPYVSEDRQQNTIKDALSATLVIGSRHEREEMLSKLAPLLSQPLLEEAVIAIRETGDRRARTEALVSLSPWLASLDPPSDALETVHTIEGIEERSIALRIALAEIASRGYGALALDRALAMEDEKTRATALAGISPYLSKALLKRALAAVLEMESSYERTETLTQMVPFLSETLLREVLSKIPNDEPQDQIWHTRVFVALLPRLAQLGCAEEAFARARDISDSYHRSLALSMIVKHSPTSERIEVFEQALAAIREIADDEKRVQALTALTPQLGEEFITHALDLAKSIANEYWRAQTLINVSPYLSEPLTKTALTIACQITFDLWRTGATSRLNVRLAELGYAEEALAAAREIPVDYHRGMALAAIAAYLPDADRRQATQEALAAAETVASLEDRLEITTSILWAIPEETRDDVLTNLLETSCAIQDSYRQAWALMRLIPHLPEPTQGLWEVLVAVSGIEDPNKQEQALTQATRHFLEQSPATLQSLWCGMTPRLAMRMRKDVLSTMPILAPVIAKLGGPEAIAETFHAIQDVGRWWP
jgi:hypothetical protein